MRQLLAGRDHVGILISVLQAQGRDTVFQGRNLSLHRRIRAAIARQSGSIGGARILDIAGGIGLFGGIRRQSGAVAITGMERGDLLLRFIQLALIDRDLRIQEDIGLAEIALGAILGARHELGQEQPDHIIGLGRIGGGVVEFGEAVAGIGNNFDLVAQRQDRGLALGRVEARQGRIQLFGNLAQILVVEQGLLHHIGAAIFRAQRDIGRGGGKRGLARNIDLRPGVVIVGHAHDIGGAGDEQDDRGDDGRPAIAPDANHFVIEQTEYGTDHVPVRSV